MTTSFIRLQFQKWGGGGREFIKATDLGKEEADQLKVNTFHSFL